MSMQDSSLGFSKCLKHLSVQTLTRKRSLCLGLLLNTSSAFGGCFPWGESPGMMVTVFCDAFIFFLIYTYSMFCMYFYVF